MGLISPEQVWQATVDELGTDGPTKPRYALEYLELQRFFQIGSLSIIYTAILQQEICLIIFGAVVCPELLGYWLPKEKSAANDDIGTE